ncbi:MAG: DUF1850 domain-containing protein [Tissierellia bacterium]|nr:DUF1850 domain-containing protein [Tissierellia bacterium]
MKKALNDLKMNSFEGRFCLPSKYLLLILPIILAILACLPINILYAEDFTTGEFLFAKKLNRNSYIGIIYTHSVEKTSTSEWYRFENDNLILMEERFKSLGAGLPADSPYKFEKTDDGFRLYDIEKPFEYVIYRTGAVHANHILDIDGKKIKFTDFSQPMQAVSFSVKKSFYAQLLYWRCINGK